MWAKNSWGVGLGENKMDKSVPYGEWSSGIEKMRKSHGKKRWGVGLGDSKQTVTKAWVVGLGENKKSVIRSHGECGWERTNLRNTRINGLWSWGNKNCLHGFNMGVGLGD